MTTSPIGVIAHYNLLEALPPSGPGDLFRARDTIRGRTVIIRRLPHGFASGAAREPFESVARALAGLSHPNVIRLFEIGDDEGCLYLVFEHLQGRSLRGELEGRPLNVRRAVELAIQMSDAVADAHAAGYMHGGLSPDSVVITAKGHAKIPAHELACREGFDATSKEPRLIDYPSPEEVAGERPDERSDVFSLGAILYEMLTGRRPTLRGSSLPSASNPHVPRALDEAVLMAVAPKAERRYASVAEMVRRLREVLAQLDAQSLSDEVVGPTVRPRPAGAWWLGVVLVCVLGLLAWWWLR